MHRLAQLCLARHASSQAGRGRLLAYKPALKQRAELQVSGSEQLRCIATGQLSHGNRLLSCTVPAKAGANTPLTRVQEAESVQAACYHGSADPW